MEAILEKRSDIWHLIQNDNFAKFFLQQFLSSKKQKITNFVGEYDIQLV